MRIRHGEWTTIPDLAADEGIVAEYFSQKPRRSSGGKKFGDIHDR
jgi:hypothetical protein